MAYATNSYGNYSGTIVSSPIRPFGPITNIATVFSNEIKGGHHNYETISERDSLIEERRDWGMLVTIYNDITSTNNKTYKLEYNFSSSSLMDNLNWIDYNPGGSSNLNSEWSDSVQEIAQIPSTLTDGYRYLVANGGLFSFSGQDNKIAIYNLSSANFTFLEPTNGLTLRVDTSPNILYRYSGTFSSGVWLTEVLSSVRYLNANSIDGLTYSATSSIAPLRDFYDSVYYVNFNMTSSGTVSLVIDGLTSSSIFKLENNTLSNIIGNDLFPGIQYQLVWNGSGYQTELPSSTTTTIGPAEDSDYTDGLYIDFIPSTPIGTAVDRFNEFLKNLVPDSGPTLSSWSAIGSFVNGGVSFDDSVIGSTALSTATQSPYGSVSFGETFSSSDSYYRLGIMSKVQQPVTGTQYFQDISGILNVNVFQSTQTPIPSYSTYSFGFADLGTISMTINGITVSEIGLTQGSVDTTNSGATSGISVSSYTSSKFSSGVGYEEYQNRSGTYLVKADAPELINGYNYFIIKHLTPTNNYILNQFEFISDPSSNQVIVSTPNIQSVNTNPVNNKFLSGIEFFSIPTEFVYNGTIQNLFENTFNQDNDAVSYNELSLNLSSMANNVTNTVTNIYTSSVTTPFLLNSKIIPNGSITPNQSMIISMTYSLNTDVRRINDNIGFGVTVKRTVQGTFIGGTSGNVPVSTDNWFIDSVSPTSTTSSENFDDEYYRILNGSTKYNTYNTTSEILIGTWSSSSSILSSLTHRNGLQVINGLLVYPTFDFTTPGTIVTNPNYGAAPTRIYSNCFTVNSGFGTYSASPATNNRTYTRWFFFGNIGFPVTNYSGGKISITHQNVTFVNTTIPLINPGASNPSSDVCIEVKLPFDSGVVPGGTMSTGAVTGWLDATLPFSGNYEDGDGCLSGIVPTQSGGEWIVDFGIKGTEFSGGYVLLRVTAGQDWVGNISNINFVPYL